MQASETKLQDIIEGTRQYVIPLFQRSYSWQKSDWELLWNDIKELYDTQEPYPHFMGSIVTMQTNSLQEGVTKYLLIDGQQRLTTILILLAVLRDKAKQPEIADEINNRFLVNAYSKEFDYYKLQPTQIDREAFYKIIQFQANKKDKNNSIDKCYLFFEKEISKTKNLEFSRIKEIICKNLLLVRILLGKDDNPYLVFESLNAKGKPLTQADLIRNYFFMKINHKQQDSIYKQYWLPMQNLLGDNLTEFIRHYIAKNNIIVNKNQVYFTLKNNVDKGDAITYLKDIYQFAQYYGIFLNPTLEENIKIRKYLARIKRLDVATIYPFLLNCYDDWKQEKLTELELVEILKIIENFILRRFVCNVQTRGLNKTFPSLYNKIINKINLENTDFIKELKLNLQRQKYPKNEEFREKLMTMEIYGRNRTEKAKLILESLEESFGHREIVVFDKLTIEHIMPQTLNDWWKNHLGEDYEITHELLIHSLGNLTLTAYNSELSNKEFSVKKEEFNNSHLEINKYFNNVEYWQRKDIEKRAEILANKALEIWKYFGDESVKYYEKSDVTGTIPNSLKMLGKEYSVKSWRDVLEKTLNVLADEDEDKFNEIVTQFPRFLSENEHNFQSTRQLNNGIFVEVSLSAKDIYTFCQKAIEIADLSSEDWNIITNNSE